MGMYFGQVMIHIRRKSRPTKSMFIDEWFYVVDAATEEEAFSKFRIIGQSFEQSADRIKLGNQATERVYVGTRNVEEISPQDFANFVNGESALSFMGDSFTVKSESELKKLFNRQKITAYDFS